MTTTATPSRELIRPPVMSPDDSWLDIVSALLLVQGAVALLSTLELGVAVMLGFAAAALANLGLAVLGTGLTIYAALTMTHARRRVRRMVVVFQVGWLVVAGVDMGLALALTQRPFELVPFLSRVILPFVILRLLRSERARLVFGLRLSRRQRRRIRKGMRP